MNTPALNPQIKSMSLKDITDLLETRHNDAMKTVDKMAESPEFGELRKIRSHYIGNSGQKIPLETYALDKRQSVAVAAKLNTALLMRVIDRWQELEQPHAQTPATLSRMQLIQMAMESELANQALQVQVETQQQEIAALEPQAEALKRIAVFAEGTYCIRDSAKLLQVEEKFLKAWLSEHDWIYRRPTGGGWLGYSDKLKKGYLEHKLTTGDKTDGSGTQWSSNQVRITSKGLAKLSLLLNQGAQA